MTDYADTVSGSLVAGLGGRILQHDCTECKQPLKAVGRVKDSFLTRCTACGKEHSEEIDWKSLWTFWIWGEEFREAHKGARACGQTRKEYFQENTDDIVLSVYDAETNTGCTLI